MNRGSAVAAVRTKGRLASIAIGAILLAGCGNLTGNAAATSNASNAVSASAIERPSSEMPDVEGRGPYTGFIVTFDRRIVSVQYEEIGGLAVVGGDMVVGTHEEMQQRAALLSDLLAGDADRSRFAGAQQQSLTPVIEQARREGVQDLSPQTSRLLVNILGWSTMDPAWPVHLIPYDIDPGIPPETTDPRRKNIRAAVAMWNGQSALQIRSASELSAADQQHGILVFVDHPANDQNFACMSEVGYHAEQGRQNVYINPKCEAGNIAHEIGHALGLFHEHQRDDRATFLAVDSKVPQDTRNYAPIPGHYLTSHDLCSIMHYAPDTTKPDWFALTQSGRRAHQACEVALPNRIHCRDVGQRCQPSPADVESIKKLFG